MLRKYSIILLVLLVSQSWSMSLKEMKEEMELREMRHSTVASLRENCHPSCKTCTGTDEFSCSSCFAGKKLTSSKNGFSCLESNNDNTQELGNGNLESQLRDTKKCPSGSSLDYRTKTCVSCGPGCESCLVGGKKPSCLGCMEGYRYNPVLTEDNKERMRCIKGECRLGQFLNEEANMCQICDKSCYACSSVNKSNCTECPPGYDLVPMNYGHGCVKNPDSEISCSSSQYYDSEQQKCLDCSPTCLTCRDYNSCSSCKSMAYALVYSPKHLGLSCLRIQPDCKSNQFVDYDNECRNCNISCASCSGPYDRDCYQCSKGYEFKTFFDWARSWTRCVKSNQPSPFRR